MRVFTTIVVVWSLLALGCAPQFRASFDAKLGYVQPDDLGMWTPPDYNTYFVIMKSPFFWDEHVKKHLQVSEEEFAQIKDGVEIWMEPSPDHPRSRISRISLCPDDDGIYRYDDERFYEAMYDFPVWRITVSLEAGDQSTFDAFKFAFEEFFTSSVESQVRSKVAYLQEIMARMESHEEKEAVAERIRRYEGIDVSLVVGFVTE